MKKLAALFLTALILITVFTACSGEIQDSSVSSDNTHNITSQYQSSTELPENTLTLEERKEIFLKMANHDNYIMGYISESYIKNDDVKNYVIVETIDAKKYRVEGFDSENPYLAGYFFLNDSCSVYPDSIIGKNVIFFYDEAEKLNDGTYYIEKAKEFLLVREDSEMTGMAKLLQKRADILIKNFNAIQDPKLLSPEEAMLAIIDKYNLENMERVIDKQGCLIYQNEEGYRLVLERVLFNESLGMSTQEIEEHRALINSYGLSRPQWGAYPEIDGKDNYVIYVIAFEKRLPDDWYVDVYNASVTGEITKR